MHIDDGGIAGPAFHDRALRLNAPVLMSPKRYTDTLPARLRTRPVVDPCPLWCWSLVTRANDDRETIAALREHASTSREPPDCRPFPPGRPGSPRATRTETRSHRQLNEFRLSGQRATARRYSFSNRAFRGCRGGPRCPMPEHGQQEEVLDQGVRGLSRGPLGHLLPLAQRLGQALLVAPQLGKLLRVALVPAVERREVARFPFLAKTRGTQVPVRPDLAAHLAQIAPEVVDGGAAPEPVAVVDLCGRQGSA